MNKDACRYIGYFTKLYGTDLGLLLNVAEDVPEQHTEPTVTDNLHIGVEIDGQLVPFFVQKDSWMIRHAQQSRQVKIHLDCLNTEEEARELINCPVYLPLCFIQDTEANTQDTDLSAFTGFQVVDQQHGYIGILEDVMILPQQSLLQVFYEGQEILIPAETEFIEGIDTDNKIIYIVSPEGLIDLFLA